MTVKQLMQKLKSVPEDYEVTVFMTDAVVNGWYKTDGIDIDEDAKQVEITSNYEYLWNWEKQKWENLHVLHMSNAESEETNAK